MSSRLYHPLGTRWLSAFFCHIGAFICNAAFLRDFLAVAWMSCILETKVSEAGVRKGVVDFVPGSTAGVVAIVDFEGTFTGGRVCTIVMSKRGKREPFCPGQFGGD